MENRACPHCGKPVIKSEIPEYVWQCLDCDEDFYDFECVGNFDPAYDYIGSTVDWDGEKWLVDNCDEEFKDEDEETSLFLIPAIYKDVGLYEQLFDSGKLDFVGYWVPKSSVRFKEEA